jgi:hypothetical protein
MSKDFKEGFKEGFTLGSKLGYKLGQQGCGSTDIEDLFQTGRGPPPFVKETDPQAATLGYKADTSKVDKKKYPKYKAGSKCGNCALFMGKATDSNGGCPLFSGKQVSAAGWCNAWNKKA